MEISAKENINIDQAFRDLVDIILNKVRNSEKLSLMNSLFRRRMTMQQNWIPQQLTCKHPKLKGAANIVVTPIFLYREL